MEYKAGPLAEFDVDTAEGVISGHVARFNTLDRAEVPGLWAGDVILPGAFKASLAKRLPINKIPLLKQHDIQTRIGRPLFLREDAEGLAGSFKISKTTAGKDELILIADDVVNTFSFGYSIMKGGAEVKSIHPRGIRGVTEGVPARYLSEIDIKETSTVVLSIEDGATINSIKADEPMEAKSEHGLADLSSALNHAHWVEWLKRNGDRLTTADEKVIRGIIRAMREGASEKASGSFAEALQKSEQVISALFAEALHGKNLLVKADIGIDPPDISVEPDSFALALSLLNYSPPGHEGITA